MYDYMKALQMKLCEARSLKGNVYESYQGPNLVM